MAVFLAALLAGQDPDVRALLEKLRSDSIEERETAARKLSEAGASALPELEKAARDPDAEVAARARAVLEFVRLLSGLTPAFRKALPDGEKRLREKGPSEAARIFLEARDLSGADLDALSPFALRAAREPAEKRRLCLAVGALGCGAAALEVATLVGDRERSVRSAAVLALRHLPAGKAALRVRPFLGDGDPEIRESAVLALEALGAKDSAGDILKQLEDPESPVFDAAAWAAGKLGVREAIPHLLKQTDSGAALEALTLLRAREALPLFLKSADDVNRENLVHRIREVAGRDAIPDLRGMMRDSEEGVREAVMEAFGTLGTPDVVPDLLRGTKASRPAVRVRAVVGLSRLGAKEAEAEWPKLLENPDADCRSEAAHAAGRAGLTALTPRLQAMLRDPIGHVRGAAARALGQLGSRESIPLLTPLLRDFSDNASEAAASSLCLLGSREGVPVLLERARQVGALALVPLNALRRPEAWGRTLGRSTSARLHGPRLEMLSQLAKDLGVRLEVTPGGDQELDFFAIGSYGSFRGQSAYGLAMSILWVPASRAGVVLEEDRLRLLSEAEAMAFWKAWWDEVRPR